MAVTWRGSTVTPPIICPPISGTYVFGIINTFRSRHKINILRFVCMGDSTEVSTTAGHVMPIIRAHKCAASIVSGGAEFIGRVPWDTNLNSAATGVRMIYSGYGVSNNPISVGASVGTAWEQFIQRGCNATEQRRTIDNSVLSRLTAIEDFSINPGEALVVSWHHGTQPVGGSIIFNLAWEEDEIDAGFTVGGTVTLNSVPVNGARVFVLTDNDTQMPNPELMALNTSGSGQFSRQVATGVKVAVFVQHDNGTKYTDEGKPFIEGP